jgi:hypothetical protein
VNAGIRGLLHDFFAIFSIASRWQDLLLEHFLFAFRNTIYVLMCLDKLASQVTPSNARAPDLRILLSPQSWAPSLHPHVPLGDRINII